MKNLTRPAKAFLMLVGLLASITFGASQGQTKQVQPEGDWKGTLDAGVAKYALVLHVSKKDDALSATLDSPDQGATDLLIDSISVTGKSLRFEMKSLGASYEGVFSEDGSQIEGEFSQQGQRLPLMFKRVTQSESSESVLKLQKVDVGGHGLQLLVGGHGSPAVIFEGGFGVGIASWSMLQRDVAEFAQTVSYDRAGIGQSDLGPKPRSAKQIATELHAALQKAGVKPPYVMVGHSLGGIFVRVFADMYPREVVGMVLIDPSQESFNDWLGKNYPDRLKAAESNIASAGEGPKSEFAALDTSHAQAREAKVPAGIPITLLTATEDESMPAEARKVWIEKHKEWLATIPGSKHIVVERATHFIQAQQPALVIDTIKQVLKQIR
jgi:pimeloyl-ACP methyl ester carboxylesterase